MPRDRQRHSLVPEVKAKRFSTEQRSDPVPVAVIKRQDNKRVRYYSAHLNDGVQPDLNQALVQLKYR